MDESACLIRSIELGNGKRICEIKCDNFFSELHKNSGNKLFYIFIYFANNHFFYIANKLVTTNTFHFNRFLVNRNLEENRKRRNL